MQDQDAPQVEGGETGGGAAVAEAEIPADVRAAISSMAEFTVLPWTTATGLRWQAAIMGRGLGGHVPVLLPITRKPIWNRFLRVRMPIPASSDSWTISFSRPRFRKPRAS